MIRGLGIYSYYLGCFLLLLYCFGGFLFPFCVFLFIVVVFHNYRLVIIDKKALNKPNLLSEQTETNVPRYMISTSDLHAKNHIDWQT